MRMGLKCTTLSCQSGQRCTLSSALQTSVFVSYWRGWLNLPKTLCHSRSTQNTSERCRKVWRAEKEWYNVTDDRKLLQPQRDFRMKVFKHLKCLNLLWDMDLNLHPSFTPKLIRSAFSKVQLLALISFTLAVHLTFSYLLIYKMNEVRSMCCLHHLNTWQMWWWTMWAVCHVMLLCSHLSPRRPALKSKALWLSVCAWAI